MPVPRRLTESSCKQTCERPVFYGYEKLSFNFNPVNRDDVMDGTRGTETPREMLSRRLADAVGPDSPIGERAASEENELSRLFGKRIK